MSITWGETAAVVQVEHAERTVLQPADRQTAKQMAQAGNREAIDIMDEPVVGGGV